MNLSDEAISIVMTQTRLTTESVAKLAGLGAKNLAVILFAMMNDMASKEKLYGETTMNTILKEPTSIIPIKKEAVADFKEAAKRLGILFKVTADKDRDNPNAFIIVRQTDDENVKLVFKEIGYVTQQFEQEKNQKPHSELENKSKEQKKDSKNRSGVIVDRIENAKMRLANQTKTKPKGKIYENKNK